MNLITPRGSAPNPNHRKQTTEKTMKTTETFATRAEAQKIVDQLDRKTYYLAHGEHSRPDYTVRKVKGEDAYYIHARRYYYAGTLHARPSGPLGWEDINS